MCCRTHSTNTLTLTRPHLIIPKPAPLKVTLTPCSQVLVVLVVALAVAAVVGPKGALAAGAASGYWNEDTAYVCYRGHHAWLAGLGAAWMVLFGLRSRSALLRA